jgi:hypothetical protein
VDKVIARKLPVPPLNFETTELSDCQVEDIDALTPMRLAAEPDDDPSNEPINTTNFEPEASGKIGAVEFDTVGNVYDRTLVSNADLVSTDTDTMLFDPKP